MSSQRFAELLAGVAEFRWREAEMIERSARRSVPQIFIDGAPVGGYDDLAALNASGKLDRRLELVLRGVKQVSESNCF